MTRLVVPLTDPEAVDAGRFGPKAANQAALGRAGLPIPDGFCLGAEAYRLQLAELGLEEAVRAATSTQSARARHHLAEVRLGLFEQPIVPTVLKPLLGAWQALAAASDTLSVVRSSALMEDRAGTTFAGQFESFLGLDGEADFLTAVRACWAALWSTRALRYMASHDLNPAATAMALLVQPLVAARASGGGLSHTADGGMLISATWGLGSAIAQGEVVPDRFELSRDGQLRDAAPGRKDHLVGCVHYREEPTTSAVARELVSEPCLDGAQVVELGRMLRAAEDVLGVPVEIEWALDDGGFKLLQARPLHMEPAQVPDEIWLRHPGLKGHPAGIGWGSGRACVINCECELSRVAPGDVLVTRVPGPALSQVLPRVAGVVAELGGSTSHLASLARERGIPMVLGVLDATQLIPDGGQVAVDGVAGVVRWIR
ncbi:MAG: PEP/pyruvate-binding domain-containing protein [Alphaproteobacteria bacterium]|jgi:pyruvate,water dikinase|nr:PEP/pyruvate-binding domain-containing protein [Alphaproteobacteria bacterium]MDP6515361.1 PEP/pyruvate-binding domain-containing protein [Alphaproteobacteria bacterium]